MNILKIFIFILLPISIWANEQGSSAGTKGLISSYLDESDTSWIYFDIGDLKQRENGVAKRDSLYDKRRRDSSYQNFRKPTPIHDVLAGMGAKDLFLLPTDSEKLQNLSSNITTDVLEEFLSKPLSTQKGIDFYDPKDGDRNDTPITLMLNYLEDSQNNPNGYKFTDKQFREFILFTREKIFGKAFANNLTDEEFEKVVNNLNKVRDIVRTFTMSPDGSGPILNQRYRIHTENILKSVLFGKFFSGSDYKLDGLERSLPSFAEDILIDTVYKLIPQYAKQFTGNGSDVASREEIARKIRQLMANHEFSYFKNSMFNHNSLKGNFKNCLEKALVADAMISCIKEFAKSSHGKLIEIALESIKLGEDKDVSVVEFSLDHNVREHFLKNFKNFANLEILENDLSIGQFYLDKRLNILNQRRLELSGLDFNQPTIQIASFNLIDDIESSDPEYLKLRILYAVEKSANDWFDEFLRKFASGVGVDVASSVDFKRLKDKFKGEDGLIRKVILDFLENTDFGNDTNIFSSYLDIVDKGLPLILKNIKDALNDKTTEDIMQKIARETVDKKLNDSLKDVITNTPNKAYRSLIINNIKKITDTAINNTFVTLRGVDDQEFTNTLLDTSQRESFTKRIIIGAITTNESNVKNMVDLILDQTIERYKIRPYAKLDGNNQFIGFEEAYIQNKNKLVNLVISEANKQVSSSIEENSLKDLLNKYESIAIDALRRSLIEDSNNNTNFRARLELGLKDSTDWAIDYYTDQLNKLLDYHLVSRDPLYRDSFLSVFGVNSDCQKYFKFFKTDVRHFGESFIITREKLKASADLVIQNLLTEIEKNPGLKSKEDIKEAINQRLRLEVKKFIEENESSLNKMSENFANRAVCDLIPVSDFEKGSDSEKTFIALKDHLTNELGPRIFNNFKNMDADFNFFDKSVILDQIKDSTLDVTLSTEGTLDKIKDFLKSLTSEKVDKFLGRYKNSPEVNSLINKLKKQINSDIDNALILFADELKGQPLTLEGITKFIENFDKKSLELIKQSFLTRVDPRDNNSKFLSEALGLGIVNYEVDKIATLLNIKEGTPEWEKIERLKNELSQKSIPQLVSNIQNLDLNLGYTQGSDAKTILSAMNNRYKNYFLGVRQHVVDAFNDPKNKELVKDAVDTYIDNSLMTTIKSSILPRPAETYDPNSTVMVSLAKLQDKLKEESHATIDSLLNYNKTLKDNENPIDRIRQHVDESIDTSLNSIFTQQDGVDSFNDVVTDIADSIFEDHLKAFFNKVGIFEPGKVESFIEFKNKFVDKFRKEFFPILHDHIKSSFGESFFDRIKSGELKDVGASIFQKSFESFNKIFLNDPEMRDYLYQMSDVMIEQTIDQNNPLLNKRYSNETQSPTEKYIPILKNEIKLFIQDVLDANGETLTSVEDLFRKVQEQISKHIYTPHRTMYLSEMAARSLYSEEGYKQIKNEDEIISKIHEIVTADLSQNERRKLLEQLTKRSQLTFTYSLNGNLETFVVDTPSKEWEYLSVAELLTSPELRMKENEALDPFLERLSQESINEALGPFGGRLMDFIKYQTFCDISDKQDKQYPCHSDSNPILTKEMGFLIEFLRNSAMAPYSEKGGECFNATWNLLSKESFSKHLENEKIELFKYPLKAVALFVEKEGITYQERPPSFMDCSVLAYGVGFGEKIPHYGLDILAQNRPDVSDNVARMKNALSIYASPQSFRSYLESPSTQASKKKMQENLVNGLKRFTFGNGESEFDNPHEALMSQFVTTLTHEYLPSISKSDEYRQNSLKSLILIKKEDPGELLKATSKLLLEGETDRFLDENTGENSWLAGATGTNISNWISEKLKSGSDEVGSIITESVDYIYEISNVFDEFGYTSKAKDSDIELFAKNYPNCFASFNNDFNAPILLSIQFMAAAQLENKKRYINRDEVEIDPAKTFSDLQNYLHKETCLDYTIEMEPQILKTATAISEIVSNSMAFKQGKRPESFSDFWEKAAKEFGHAGSHVKDFKQKLDMMLWIFNPNITKENMCHETRGTSSRLQSRYEEGPLKVFKEKRAKLEGLKSMNFVKRWYFSDEIEEAEQEFQNVVKQTRRAQDQVQYMKQCLKKDCQ